MHDSQPTAYVYVDGFNLYYGALFNTKGCKWLDLRSLCEKLFGDIDIKTIKYFTADIKPDPRDQDGPRRQSSYLRALATDSDLEVIKGHFVSRQKQKPLVNPMNKGACVETDCPKGSKKAKVWITEEKMSDVNLATHLLCDGFLGLFDVAIVITNDSDLCKPIELVQKHNKVTVRLVRPLIPKDRKGSKELDKVACKVKDIRRQGLLNSCQFPENLTDSQGNFSKPPSW